MSMIGSAMSPVAVSSSIPCSSPVDGVLLRPLGAPFGHAHPHPGGFTRLTLVPKDAWTSREAHDKRAFWYSCWSAGREACTASNKDIGTGGRCYDDKDGSRFGTSMTIPRVVPDGDYVLGYAWFGGLGSDMKSSFLGDCTWGGTDRRAARGGRLGGRGGLWGSGRGGGREWWGVQGVDFGVCPGGWVRYEQCVEVVRGVVGR